MLGTLFNLMSPYLMRKDPEAAHILTIRALHMAGLFLPKCKSNRAPSQCLGMNFPSRLGIAAGFDKNAEAVDGLFKLGFGFVEIGTVTPLPQQGNPQPRLFRLPEDTAVINRMGFNNDGAERVSARLKKRADAGKTGIVGVNIGANKDSEDRVKDYGICAKYFTDTASYFTVNVSSPNTAGLRNLQSGENLLPLLEGVLDVAQAAEKNIPVLLKIAPDLMQEDIEEIADVVNNLPIAGVIATNTTIARPDTLISKAQSEAGGLSGAPVFDPSNAVLSSLKSVLYPEKIIVGVGGIDSARAAKQKLELGADLLQLYSALVYKGPQLITDILQMLEAEQ